MVLQEWDLPFFSRSTLQIYWDMIPHRVYETLHVSVTNHMPVRTLLLEPQYTLR